MENIKNNKYINAGAALIIFGLLLYGIWMMYPGRDNFKPELLWQWRDTIFLGWGTTIIISLITLVFSIIVGFGLYLLMSSKILVFRYLGNIFNEVIFGLPLIVFSLIVFYFIAAPLNIANRFIMGSLALSLYMAPYMKNLFEGAMKTIDDLQYQAMTVFGFTTYQKYRYIIIPQLLKVIIPPLVGNLTFIVKGSAILNFIGVQELYNQITTAQSNSYVVVEGYLLMGVMYLAITIPLIRITKYFEKKVSLWN